jgi:hypothetical protein
MEASHVNVAGEHVPGEMVEESVGACAFLRRRS